MGSWEDSRTLVFEPSEGKEPEYGTLEYDLWRVCCDEDPETLDRLCGVPHRELEVAVANLRKLGWNFHFVSLQ